MKKDLKVQKRNKTHESLQIDKIHKVVSWACENIPNVSVSEIELIAEISFYDKIKTSEIHDLLINSAKQLIISKNVSYDKVAQRLLNQKLRKEIYNSVEVPHILEVMKKGISDKVYDKEIIDYYSVQEWDIINSFLDHEKDFTFSFAGLSLLKDKYLVKNVSSKKIYETPQIAFGLISAVNFAKEDPSKRLDLVKDFYEAISTFKIGLPTPIQAGLRTPTKNFSSCCLIEVEDSKESIAEGVNAVMEMTSLRAGIGLSLSSIRSMNSDIGNGYAKHSGVPAIARLYESTINSMVQGTRKGSGNIFYLGWHIDFLDLVVLKSNKLSHENTVKGMDHSFLLCGLFYERFKQGGDITLFCPKDVPDMYEAFFNDDKKFRELYVKYENKKGIRKKVISAEEYFTALTRERRESGRVYICNIDLVNRHSSFDEKVHPIKMSNLCVAPETKILTKEYGYKEIYSMEDEEVHVWNGQEWSKTIVKKTSDNSRLIKVIFQDDSFVECTEYHRFFINNNYSRKSKVVRAIDLKSGDKLEKFDLPKHQYVYNEDENSKRYYSEGFYSAEGNDGYNHSWIYSPKKSCSKMLIGEVSEYLDNTGNRFKWKHGDLDKFRVPYEGNLNDRLSWIAGLLDGDGCSTKSVHGNNIQLCSVQKDFLHKVRLLLQEMGIYSSIIKKLDEGFHHLPKNDGTGEKSMYFCRTSYLLTINCEGVKRLCEMNTPFQRLKLFETQEPNRNASRLIKVKEIVLQDRFDKTYCFTEQKLGKGIFNGVLLGNCMEITLPTKPVLPNGGGSISLCTLGSINFSKIDKPEDLEKSCFMLVRFLDNMLDYQNYQVPQTLTNKEDFRPLGVGVNGFAHFLAKKGLLYDHTAYETVFEYAEAQYFYLMRANMILAKERGACKENHNLKKKFVFETYTDEELSKIKRFCKMEFRQDWVWLRGEIEKYGLRHATVSAIMPSENNAIAISTTSSINKVKSLISIRQDNPTIVPEYEKLKDKYDLLWSDALPHNYLKIVSIFQLFTDQAISTDTFYADKHFEGNIPQSRLIKDLILAYDLNLKCLYYDVTFEGSSSIHDIPVEESDEGCEGCKL